MRKIIHRFPKRFAILQDVIPGQSRRADAALSEKVSTKHRSGPGIHQEARFPAVRQMGRIEPLYRTFPQGELGAVCHCMGWSIREIIH
jgi:hypothetical protein